MTNHFTNLAAAAALFTGLSAPASAADPEVSLGTAGGWDMSADNDTCAGGKKYANGTSLIFGVRTDGVAVIVIDNPAWKIPKGTYPVVAQVDRAPPVTFQAHANGDLVALQWGISQDEINLVSYGAVFRVKIGRADYSYRLDGTAAMLQALGRCAVSRLAMANPFAGTAPQASAPPSNPFPETASNPYRRM
jgi:hypothetical protein